MRRFENTVASQLARSLSKAMRDELVALKRRIARLQAVERGDAKIVKIWRNGYTVRRHTVRGHYMHIVRSR